MNLKFSEEACANSINEIKMKKTAYAFLFSVWTLSVLSLTNFPQSDSLKASKRWGKWLPAFDLKANDTIISLGCGNGWREFELSLLTNKLTFYLEDLDSVSLNQLHVNKAKTQFTANRKSPLTNTFQLIYGTTRTIPVQDSFAQKVMIMNAYHHFDNKDEMLKEIYRILKYQGRLIITDHVSLTKSKESSYGCDRKYYLLNEKDLVDQITKANFKLISVTKMEKKTRVFVFEKVSH